MSTASELRSRFTVARRRPRRSRQAKGAAELSAVVTVGAMVAGVFFGQGLSSTAVELADGLTWLSDDPSGEVVQVNPATGRPQVRIKAGEPGEDLDIAQYDGRLFVTNHTSGQLMSFDLTSILVSGQRRVTSGGVVETLAHDGSYFLVDGDESTIAAVDPVTTDHLGTIWVSPNGLADAVIDQTGTVWALEDNGELHELRWSESEQEFRTLDISSIEMSGEGSVLVAHDKGATIFGPDQGIVVQAGTGRDLVVDAPKLSGDLFAPETAPADLVPVAAPDTGTVVIATPDGVREVDLTSVACATPGTPEVFREIIYVPCQGESKVVRLDPEGARADDDIETPGSTSPELVLDDDSLIINTPGSPNGVVVHEDGSTSTIVRTDDDIPATDASGTSEPPPPPDDGIIDDLLENDPLPEPQPEEPEGGQDPENDPPSQPQGPPDNQGGGDGEPDGGGTQGPGQEPSGGNANVGGNGNGATGGNGVVGGGGNGNGNGSNNNPDPTELLLTAPANVRAVAMPEGQVQVTWEHGGVPPERFKVGFYQGADILTLGGTSRQAVVTMAPGKSVAFVVTAYADGEREQSRPSNIVTTSGRPSAPSSVSGSAEYKSNPSYLYYQVTVNWGAASGNGSEISRYDIAVTTPDGTLTTSTNGAGRTATVEWSCSLEVDPNCGIGGNFSATVTAVNGLGAGPAGTVSGVGPPQPAPPRPAAGRQLVSSQVTQWTGSSLEGIGRTTLTLAPPADWAAFAGTCEWQHAGNIDGVASGPVDCDATSLTVEINNGYLRRPHTGKVDHAIIFTARNDGGSAQSARYVWTTTQETLCRTCQIP